MEVLPSTVAIGGAACSSEHLPSGGLATIPSPADLDRSASSASSTAAGTETAPLAPNSACLAAAGGAGGGARPPAPHATPRPSADLPASPIRAPAGLTSRDWPAYHRDAARSGAAPALPAAGRLAIAWTRRLDGAVWAQPLVIGGLVIAPTQGDTLYGPSHSPARLLS